MKRLLILLLFLLPCCSLFAQREKRYVKKGNESYDQKNYAEAEAEYRKSLARKAQNVEGNFNLGNALYKQKKYTEADEQFNKIIGSANNNKTLAANAYHNLGNSLLADKKLEESIDAYKKSLLDNPKDDETRYNLAYAQEKLKQQQQKDKKNQDSKNQDKKNQDNKNQDKKDDKNKDDKNKDKKDQQNQDKKDQKGQPQPDKISKEDAQRMLDAMNNNEKQTQDKLKNKKLKGAKLNITKDW